MTQSPPHWEGLTVGVFKMGKLALVTFPSTNGIAFSRPPTAGAGGLLAMVHCFCQVDVTRPPWAGG